MYYTEFIPIVCALTGLILAALLRRLDAAAERLLVARIARREERALEQLYDQYAALLYSVAIAILKKQDEAEDVLQEIFVQIWHKASTFDTSRENVYAWLTALARNRAIDRVRSRAYRSAQQEVAGQIPESAFPERSEPPLDAMIMQERAEQVRQALRQIPEEQRILIERAYYEGLSQSQMAEQMHLPLGTVKTRMRQGMKKLYELLSEPV